MEGEGLLLDRKTFYEQAIKEAAKKIEEKRKYFWNVLGTLQKDIPIRKQHEAFGNEI